MLLDTISPPPLTIEPIEPEHLVGDAIQPGHPLFGLIWINRGRLGGTPCFYASRVPIISLFHYLAGGDTIEIFLDCFPGVTREQVLGVLDLATRGLIGKLDQIEAPPRPQPSPPLAAAAAGA